MQSEPEIRLWVAEGTANGMRPWVTKFSGVLYDRRWLPIVERIYDWHYAPRTLSAQRGAARARGAAPLGADGGLSSRRRARAIAHEDHVLGMYHALVEARVPFELVHEAFLTPDRLDPFKLLILADAAALSDAQCDAIRDVRRRAAAACSRRSRRRLYDETGRRRDDFGLADRVRRVVRRPHRRADAEFVSEPRRRSGDGARHPILDGLDDTPRIINGVFRLDVRPTMRFPVAADADSDLSRICRWRTSIRASPHTDTRELYLRDLGASRVVYIPWDIDRTFWDVMCVDHRPAAAKRDRVGDERAAAGRGRRARAARRHRLAAARLDDGASRQPDEPDDDEGPAARGDSGRPSARQHPPAGGHHGRRRFSC